MSDAAAAEFSKQAEDTGISLVITKYGDGRIELKAPMKDKLLCYGLLEVARQQLDKVYLMQELQAQAAVAVQKNGGIASRIPRR